MPRGLSSSFHSQTDRLRRRFKNAKYYICSRADNDNKLRNHPSLTGSSGKAPATATKYKTQGADVADAFFARCASGETSGFTWLYRTATDSGPCHRVGSGRVSWRTTIHTRLNVQMFRNFGNTYNFIHHKCGSKNIYIYKFATSK